MLILNLMKDMKTYYNTLKTYFYKEKSLKIKDKEDEINIDLLRFVQRYKSDIKLLVKFFLI